MKKLELFKASDFFDEQMHKDHLEFTKDWPEGAKLKEHNPLAQWQREYAATAANRTLQTYLEKNAVRVYGFAELSGDYSWHAHYDCDRTHTGLLINIEPIERKCEKHEPIQHTDKFGGRGFHCLHCAKDLKMPEKWEVAE